jgi:hypothetical protein
MLNMLSVLSFDFLNLECLNHGDQAYYVAVYLWCLIPIFLGIAVVAIGVVRLVYEDRFNTSSSSSTTSSSTTSFTLSASSSASSNKVASQHIWLLLFISYIVLPPVSNKQLAVFDCISLASDKSYLRSDTSIDCGSPEYEVFSVHIIMFLMLYQCIPIVWMFLLYRQRHELNPAHVDERLAMFIRDKNTNLTLLKFLFVDYKCNKWWFEVVDMYRRITFIGILPLVSPLSAVRSSFGMVLAITSVAYFREEQPYRVEFTNVIAHIAQV